MQPFAQSLLALWRQLGLNQRVSLAIAALVIAGVVVGLVAWSRQPDYQLLYGRLAEKDASAIVSMLQAQGVPHRVSQGGGAVYVPADQVHRLRMDLAGKGLPGGDGVGFEIFDKGQFGLSDFVQRTNYNRAIQGELSRTIAQLDGVASARVMIVQPENRLLLTEQGVKPTASVFIEAAGRVESEAIDSIRHLVANSVQGLSPDDVAVVDQRGRVLSAELKQDPLLGNVSSLIRYRQQVEDYFARKVEGMLASALGSGQAIVRVSAEIDNESVSLTEEKFDPESAVIRNQTNTEDVNSTSETKRSSGGPTGVSANTPGAVAATTNAAAATAPAEGERPAITNSQNRKNNSVNYEINRTTTSTRRNPGTIRSLSAAVFIAARAPAADGTAATPRTPAELEGLRRIVVTALGLKADAGRTLEDMVSLQETPFQPAAIDPVIERLATETRIQSWTDVGSRYLALLVGVGALFIFFRLLRRQRPEPVPVELLSPAIPGVPRTAASNGNNGLTPELLNELIRQKPANVGAALRDFIGTKKN